MHINIISQMWLWKTSLVSDHSKMESQSDSRSGPVFNMENGPITEGQEFQRSDDKRSNGIGNGEMQRRIKNIPVLEERRLLALERHIKRKRRRRPYVKKMKSSEKIEHLDKTIGAPNGRMSGDPGAFDLKDEVVQALEGNGKEDWSQNETEGTGMAVSEKDEEKPNGQTENSVVQSPKINVEEDESQGVQFDKLVEYLLDEVKSEIIKKVEEGLKSQREANQSMVEDERHIKKDEGAGMEVKQENEENFSPVKEVNTSSSKNARHVDDEGWKKERENFRDEGHTDLERANNSENKIVDLGDEKAEQSFNISCTGSKEPKPKDPELEAVETNQLLEEEGGIEKTGFNIVLDDDDEDDDDDGFMPRKLFFFSFSEFKKEEASA
ncbi:uncharacterized protein LOC128181930 [Crassostrea angulata]|uniref:uncharacterized protein LOC128181930 n=1 Tax=Magallana angulata TaxID=2784310 RepID=UPI0022B1ED47|nr:uncharacterized protein LOC128181930 [Crassostrea angulata]